MADILTRGELLPPQIVTEMFNKVGGHSALAALHAEDPIPFNGAKIFTFTLDKEADIVAENGAKTKGGATVGAVTIVPIKFEYGTRVSDEFMYGTEEYRLQVLEQFAEGAAKKFARGLDLAAFHGVNPRTMTASAVVGTNNFDSVVAAANKVTYVAANADANIESAIALVEATEDAQLTGIAMAPAMRSALAALTVNGARKYPEFAFGANPGALGSMKVDVNSTVKGASAGKDVAILGDFQNAFKWGYAKEIPLEVIEYGNPDNDATLGDLKGHNQVYLRAEAYIGWGILDAARFAIVASE
ncbi:MAG: phage major capsid protein [Firmicutes bacterium]|nr:phage major capsid protein [Bacillota bacterium]